MTGIRRFSDKAEIYEKYRPSYPKESLDKILELCNMVPDKNIKVADIGSGTGKFTKLLLDAGFNVYAVEPNEKMSSVSKGKFINYDRFNLIKGTSERTWLNDNSISLITAAQSFHYFDLDKTKKEFKRILKKDGFVALLWNFRLRTSEFIKEYENTIYNMHSKKIKPTYAQNNMSDMLFKDFFANHCMFNIPNSQEFTFDELWERTLSNNNMPKEGEIRYLELYDSIKDLFDRYSKDGKVLFKYRTQIVIGNFIDEDANLKDKKMVK